MQRSFNIVEITFSSTSHGMDRKVIKRGLKPGKAQAEVDRLNDQVMNKDLAGESGTEIKSYLAVPAINN